MTLTMTADGALARMMPVTPRRRYGRSFLLAGTALAALTLGGQAQADCTTPITSVCTITGSGSYSTNGFTDSTDYAIEVSGSPSSLTIAGNVTETTWNMVIRIDGSGSVGTLTVNDSVTLNSSAYGILNYGTISTLNNYGTISHGSGYNDISNYGTIGTLLNAQSGLTYYGSTGTLNNYKVYVTNSTTFGTMTVWLSGLALSSLSATTATGTAGLTNGTTYNGVLTLRDGGSLTVGGHAIGTTAYSYTANGGNYEVWETGAGTNLYDLEFVSASSPSWTQTGKQAGGNAVGLGAALDAIAANGGLSGLLTTLGNLSTPAQYLGLKQLSANTLPSSVTSSGSTVIPSNIAIDTHLNATIADASGNKGAAAGDAFQQGSVWGQVLGNHSSLDRSSAGDGFSSNAFGLLVGADVFVADDAVAGLAFNWLRDSAKGKDDSSGNSTTTDTYQLSLYGTWRPGGQPAWVSGLVAAGINQYDQKRSIDFLGQTASANYLGLQGQAKVTAGYDVGLDDGLTASPLGSLQVMRVQNQAYTESGSSVDQSVDRQGFNNVESVIGGKLVKAFDTDLGPLSADAQAGWLHDYLHSPISSIATLAGTGYVVNTARLPSNGAQLAIGATLQQSDDLSLRLEYQGDLRPGYVSHTGLFKVRESF
jgi:outer membrane autotransporter protein